MFGFVFAVFGRVYDCVYKHQSNLDCVRACIYDCVYDCISSSVFITMCAGVVFANMCSCVYVS